MIDDAAVHSGSDEDDSEEDDGDEDGGNDYINDGFVVDDDDDAILKDRGGNEDDDDGLSDSENDSDDEDDDGDKSGQGKRRRVQRRRRAAGLTEDDMDLIAESKGTYKPRNTAQDEDRFYDDEEERTAARKAAKINDLRDELFKGGGDRDKDRDGGENAGRGKAKKGSRTNNLGGRQVAVDTFDEEGMDDFIEDDVGGTRGAYREDDLGMGPGEGVSEAQINEANDIFGTDFFDVMGDADEDRDQDDDDMFGGDEDGYTNRRRRKFREPGVGPRLGVDSDDDILDESDFDDGELDDELDDDEMFASGDEELTSEERATALRVKRDKRRKAKEERRRKKAEQRKARLRRAFEPVQLIENFCTDRDDQIRSVDAPERFFDWKTPFHGPGGKDDGETTMTKKITTEEEQEALWIVKRIPEIASEYAIVELGIRSAAASRMMTDDEVEAEVEHKKRSIVHSVVKALRFLHMDKVEPEFIRKYRADEVSSPAVRDNIYRIMDEDNEWERLINAKAKVESILDALTATAESDEALGADEEYVAKLKEDLKNAQDRLDESVKDEEKKKAEIDALDQNNDVEDEEEDDLFGDDDDDDDDDNGKNKKKVSFDFLLVVLCCIVLYCAVLCIIILLYSCNTNC